MLLRHKVFFSFDHVSFQGGIWWICGDWSAKWIVCFGKIDWIHWLVSFCGKLKRLWRIKIYRERSGPTKKGGGGNGSTDLSAGCLEVSPIPSTPPTISPHLDEFVSSKKNMFAKIVFGFVCRSLFGPETPKDGSVQTSLGRHHVHHAWSSHRPSPSKFWISTWQSRSRSRKNCKFGFSSINPIERNI